MSVVGPGCGAVSHDSPVLVTVLVLMVRSRFPVPAACHSFNLVFSCLVSNFSVYRPVS